MVDKRLLLILFFMVVLFDVIWCGEQDSLRFIAHNNKAAPLSFVPYSIPKGDLELTNEWKLLYALFFRFYKTFIVLQDIRRCSFYPSCSEYTGQAIVQYGLFTGLLMSSDRLQRCNNRALPFTRFMQQPGNYTIL